MNLDGMFSLKEILYIAFMAGFVWFELKAIRRDIVRLDKKMDKLDEKVQKHNNFDRRIVRLETLVEVQENEKQMGRTDQAI